MNPFVALMMLLGYGLAVPIVMRMRAVVAQQHRIALVGHQVGVGLAAIGWMARGRFWIAALHLGWAVAARVWFNASQAKAPR